MSEYDDMDIHRIIAAMIAKDNSFFMNIDFDRLDTFEWMKTRLIQLSFMRYDLDNLHTIFTYMEDMDVDDEEYSRRSERYMDIFDTYLSINANTSFSRDRDDIIFYIAQAYFFRDDRINARKYMSMIDDFRYYWNNAYLSRLVTDMDMAFHLRTKMLYKVSSMYLDDYDELWILISTYIKISEFYVRKQEFNTAIRYMDFVINFMILAADGERDLRVLYVSICNLISIKQYTGEQDDLYEFIIFVLDNIPEISYYYLLLLLKYIRVFHLKEMNMDIDHYISRYDSGIEEYDEYLLRITGREYREEYRYVTNLLIIMDMYLDRVQFNDDIFEYILSEKINYDELYLYLCYEIINDRQLEPYLLRLHNIMGLPQSIFDYQEYCSDVFQRNSIYFER